MSEHRNQHWLAAASALEEQGKSYVIVTMLSVKGSAPRENGTKMIVTSDEIINSIGGGTLEMTAIEQGKKMIDQEIHHHIEDYPLGTKLGQCCGGRVTLVYEYFANNTLPVAVFGAGHVARALVSLLAQLPVKVHWIDRRENEFPEIIPSNVSKVVTDDEVNAINALPNQSYILVMTHLHSLDFDIIEAALKQTNHKQFSYLGLIGSNTKALRFRNLLKNKKFTTEQIDTINCPIGMEDIPGKRPMEVAVSIAAELIQFYQASMDYSDQTFDQLIEEAAPLTPKLLK